MMTRRFEALEQESEILRKLAAQFAPASKEYLALEHAAFALAFAVTQQFDNFSKFIMDCRADLTTEQKNHLRTLGIEVD